jgi:5-methyltetrahydrofolate--homocysteine methyltransferase
VSDYLDAIAAGVVIFDGAAGTTLQAAGLGADDFGGADLEGCNEILNVTRPDVVAAMHDGFLEVGVDVIETNTFGGFGVPLAEYGIADRAYELNAAAAAIAVEAARRHSAGRPRWVAGSIGPGTKLPSLGQITYGELVAAYEVQAQGLLDGGSDLLIIETMYDLLTLKAAVAGARRAMAATGRDVPLQTQVTIETTGRMLPGTEIGAALAAIEPLGVDVLGLNCATGPDEMNEHLRYLARHSRVPIAAIPNAGLPQVVDGTMSYGLAPERLAEQHAYFITDLGVRVVGGCCGTTPAHLRAVVERCRGLTPAAREPRHEAGASSTYSFVPFAQDTSFLIVGERTNVNGSKQFREAMLSGDWEGCLGVATSQVAESAHLIDVCVDYVGRDGKLDMDELASRFATQVPAPLVLDSTEPDVLRAGLERIGGRSVLNSANLEDGDAPGSRADQVFRLAREHGAAVICLLIDEEGQARDVDWKMRVAHRLYDLAVDRYGMEPSDLIFDALTFPLTTGDDDLRGDAMATIDAIRRIKEELPGVFTILGVSNVSFGLRPAARHVINSVFLHECVAAGLDAAIIHAGRIMPLSQIDGSHRQLCLDLIYDRRRDGYDPLTEIISVFTDVATASSLVDDRTDWPLDRRLSQRIIDGNRLGLDEDLDAALAGGMEPLDIINDVLLSGMKVVGDLFASGEMQLPFVLRSAETMKAAVAHLEPHMEHAASHDRASIVLATVKGDVHDIGKNLVDIILSNNGFEVHNLGIKVGIGEMLDAFAAHGADAIGMSGLLVKSTLVMRDNLEELNRRGMSDVPVVLGGAALTRSYVEGDLRQVYSGPLFYGKNAFAGLDVMEQVSRVKKGEAISGFGRTVSRPLPPRRERLEPAAAPTPTRSPQVVADNQVFEPPFLGTRVVKGIPLDEIAAYVNETALYRNQWQFRPERGEDDARFKARIRDVFRDQLAAARADDLLVPQVVYGYFAANGDGDELVIWSDPSRATELMRFGFPRQQAAPWMCIADFFRPIESDEVDYAAFHIVTMGARVSERTARLFADDRYQEYLFLHGLGVEMAEALAEYWHHRIRTEWGFAGEDGPSLQGLFRQQYRGGRYSWGYPACPDLEDNVKVAALLDAARVGLTVGPETGYQFQPEQTTSALICHHPQAKYFVARRKGDS